MECKDTQRTRYFLNSIRNSLFNLLLKPASIALTLAIVRCVSQEVWTALSVKLPVYLTLNVVTREAFRNSCKGSQKWSQEKVDFIWLSLPGVVISTISTYLLCLFFQGVSSSKVLQDDSLMVAVKLCWLSSIVESLAEPVYNFAQDFLYEKLCSVVDVVAILTKFVVLGATSNSYHPEATIRMAACGQLVLSFLVVVFYWTFFYFEFKKKARIVKDRELHKDNLLLELPFDSMTDLLPSRGILKLSSYKSDASKVTAKFLMERLWRILTSECERFIMTFFSGISEVEKAVYDVVQNLGSFVPRTVYRPIEQQSFNYFARTVDRNKKLSEHCPSQVKEMSKVLRLLLRVAIFLSCSSLAFGFSYSHFVLWLYCSAQYVTGQGPLLLNAYCVAVSLMALNGITEAYLSAVTSPKSWIRQLSLGASSFLYVPLCYVLSKHFGCFGFIAAKCFAMLLRIALSFAFIHRHYRDVPENPLLGVVPPVKVLLVLGGALIATYLSHAYVFLPSTGLLPTIFHVGVGVVSVVCAIGVFLRIESEIGEFVISLLGTKLLPVESLLRRIL